MILNRLKEGRTQSGMDPRKVRPNPKTWNGSQNCKTQSEMDLRTIKPSLSWIQGQFWSEVDLRTDKSGLQWTWTWVVRSVYVGIFLCVLVSDKNRKYRVLRFSWILKYETETSASPTETHPEDHVSSDITSWKSNHRVRVTHNVVSLSDEHQVFIFHLFAWRQTDRRSSSCDLIQMFVWGRRFQPEEVSESLQQEDKLH